MNSKALSTTPGDKTALFVCGALHPATKTFHVPSLSPSSLVIAFLCTISYLNTSLYLHHSDDMEWVLLPLYYLM